MVCALVVMEFEVWFGPVVDEFVVFWGHEQHFPEAVSMGLVVGVVVEGGVEDTDADLAVDMFGVGDVVGHFEVDEGFEFVFLSPTMDHDAFFDFVQVVSLGEDLVVGIGVVVGLEGGDGAIR